jgi:hypothetical protein
VTIYPKTIPDDLQVVANPCEFTADNNQDWCERADALDPSGGNPDVDYPLDRTPPAGYHLLYAGTASSPDSFLPPGGTEFGQTEVDIDSKNIRLARLTFNGIFINQLRTGDIKSCNGKHASYYKDFGGFRSDVQQVQATGYKGRGHRFCIEYEIAPANIIDHLINSQPAVRVYTELDDPLDLGAEYPRVGWVFGTAGRFDRFDPGLQKKLEQLYPAAMWTSEFEYAVTDKPPPPPPSPAPAPPSGNG